MPENNWDETLRTEVRAVIAHEGNVAAASRRLGVDQSALRRFVGGKGISSPNLQKLRRGLSKVPESDATLPLPDVLASATRRTGEHLVRLSKISGYAEMVLEELQSLAAKQQEVVDSLRPWVEHEIDSVTSKLDQAATRDAIAAARAKEAEMAAAAAKPATGKGTARTRGKSG